MALWGLFVRSPGLSMSWISLSRTLPMEFGYEDGQIYSYKQPVSPTSMAKIVIVGVIRHKCGMIGQQKQYILQLTT